MSIVLIIIIILRASPAVAYFAVDEKCVFLMDGGGATAAALRFLRLGVDLRVVCEREETNDPPFADITDVNFDERERAGECEGGGGSMMMTAAHLVRCR